MNTTSVTTRHAGTSHKQLTSSTAPMVAAANRPLRVCHVSLTLKTGGLERLLCDFARLADPARSAPLFVAMREIGPFAERIREGGGRVELLSPGGRWQQIRELQRLLRREQIDVVHTHNTYPHIYATIAARLAGVPVVVNTRHGQRLGHGWRSTVPYRAATWLADRVIAVSDDAARLCVTADRLPSRKVVRIWNGIDLEQFEYRGPVDQPIAISVARLSPEKDFATLLRAIPQVVAEVPEFRLQLVGDGPERSRLEQLAAELQLGDRVEFLGECHNVPALLANAGLFVSSSLSEGISLTLLEAMAVGLPVVATAVGGNPEIVVPEETGWLLPAGSPEALASMLVTACRQRSRWPAFGQAGRQRVADHFDIHRMVDDYQTLYETLFGSRKR